MGNNIKKPFNRAPVQFQFYYKKVNINFINIYYINSISIFRNVYVKLQKYNN